MQKHPSSSLLWSSADMDVKDDSSESVMDAKTIDGPFLNAHCAKKRELPKGWQRRHTTGSPHRARTFAMLSSNTNASMMSQTSMPSTSSTSDTNPFLTPKLHLEGTNHEELMSFFGSMSTAELQEAQSVLNSLLLKSTTTCPSSGESLFKMHGITPTAYPLVRSKPIKFPPPEVASPSPQRMITGLKSSPCTTPTSDYTREIDTPSPTTITMQRAMSRIHKPKDSGEFMQSLPSQPPQLMRDSK